MKKMVAFGWVAVLLAAACQGEEAPQAAAPEKEHQWLTRLAGEWTTDAEMVMAPGQPPMKCQGTESVRTIGKLWVMGEHKSQMMGQTMNAMLTLGYDSTKKKYVGTWIDSMTAHMWKYEGSLDPSGKVLTLNTEGPNPMAAGKLCKFQEVIEIKSDDHKVLSSSMQMEDGQWYQFMTVNYRRKK